MNPAPRPLTLDDFTARAMSGLCTNRWSHSAGPDQLAKLALQIALATMAALDAHKATERAARMELTKQFVAADAEMLGITTEPQETDEQFVMRWATGSRTRRVQYDIQCKSVYFTATDIGECFESGSWSELASILREKGVK